MGSKQQSSRLVFVGDDGDVYEASGGRKPKRLTWGWTDGPTQERLQYVWPSYSPNGEHVACFGVQTGNGDTAGLYAVTDDGVSMHEIWKMDGAVPVCENWSADSAYIALLLQDGQRLRLDIADIAKPGKALALDSGSPLFWSWSPAGNLIAVHTSGSRSVYSEARLCVFDVDDGAEEVARLVPGEFRTPAWSPDGKKLAYIDASGPREFLAFFHVDDGVSEIVCPVEGHTVMLWSPDGSRLAVSQALGDTPHMFTGITMIDTRSGRTEVVSDRNVVSFFWSPCSRRLVSVALDEGRGMEWDFFDVRGMRTTLDTRFYPSRESVYFCWFFDQFATSHPLISPDGDSLVFTGHLEQDHGSNGASGVYVAPLDGDGSVTRLASGQFACWDTRLRACSD